jgi:Zn-dependent protease
VTEHSHTPPAPPGWLPPGASPDPAPQHRAQRPRRGGLGGLLILLGAVALKFKAVLLLIPKLKVLTTSASMLVSVAAYSLIWGWTFALGFVVLLLVHEMGHVIQLRREGIAASAPVFIPFLGAAVWAKSLGDDAAAEARVGLAGPVLGTLGAAALVPVALATDDDFWRALAFTGFFLNLFNLLPVVPLDGGRAFAALAPWMWFAGLFAVVALAFVAPNPIILLIALLAAFETWRRVQQRRSGGAETRAYYAVTKRQRLAIGAVYLGLVVLLVVGMDATYVERTFGDA